MMSRQRPYETFEKAFFSHLMMNESTRNRLYDLLKDMNDFASKIDCNENASIRLPWTYLTKDKEICILWSCLSRLFGEQDPWISECEIPRRYLDYTIEYIEDHIAEIVEDEQIDEVLKRG